MDVQDEDMKYSISDEVFRIYSDPRIVIGIQTTYK